MAQDPWGGQVEAFGQFLHAQRKLAKLSLRELAAMSDISNAYLSQLERGLHQPSVRVITQVAQALGIPRETLLAQAGLGGAEAPSAEGQGTSGMAEEAIRADPSLTPAQREALLAVLRSFSGD
ncbi:MAG TPA: helix-turn-helix transcriptional regulator [Miltoncostaeaceae bacterium]|jgi:transcriptional regulator with XRE-family HTH domain|nr:helix-turn-helix transcriptional regulator [Miltoncostaeaceae bacterium]